MHGSYAPCYAPLQLPPPCTRSVFFSYFFFYTPGSHAPLQHPAAYFFFSFFCMFVSAFFADTTPISRASIHTPHTHTHTHTHTHVIILCCISMDRYIHMFTCMQRRTSRWTLFVCLLGALRVTTFLMVSRYVCECLCLCVCVRACVRACLCVRACIDAFIYVCVRCITCVLCTCAYTFVRVYAYP
jgi:hypothetical protein